MKGLFIALEGIDGCGKGEQATRLAKWLFDASKENHVFLTREPTGKGFGEKVRKIVEGDSDAQSNAQAYLENIVQDRKAHAGLIEELVKKEFIVISDRFKESTFAFQQVQGISLREISRAHEGIIDSDLTILLDVPVDTALKRLGGGRDKFEKKDFLEKVRGNYLQMAKERKNIQVVDASGTPEQVFERIKKVIQDSGLLK